MAAKAVSMPLQLPALIHNMGKEITRAKVMMMLLAASV